MRTFFSLAGATSLLVVAGCGSSSDSTVAPDDSSADSLVFDTFVDSTRDSPDEDARDATGDSGSDSPVDLGVDSIPSDSSTDGGSCGDGGACTGGLTCCAGGCRNTRNDPFHCGGCGTTCSGSTSMCLAGSCQTPVCAPSCAAPQICCELDEGLTTFKCVDGPTCPVGCPLCK